MRGKAKQYTSTAARTIEFTPGWSRVLAVDYAECINVDVAVTIDQ